MKICLDYGHGGKDPGAIYKGRKESMDNLRFGLILKDQLKKEGHIIIETRTKDEYVSLRERANIANRNNVDLFLSLHRNAFIPEVGRGLEIYTYPTGAKRGKLLAKRLQSSLVQVTKFRNRGVKQGSYYILRKTKAPALLLELGFIDNSRDNKIFDNNLKQMAKTISQEIRCF